MPAHACLAPSAAPWARVSLGARLSLVLLLAGGLRGCVTYEYEHELWLRVDGSGSVRLTGRPELWSAFKQLDLPPERAARMAAARALFERSGLRVQRVTVTERDGRPYLFVSADFDDVNRLGGTPAFPDLRLQLLREGDRLRLEGAWQPPAPAHGPAPMERDGLMAVRLHLPSKVFSHKNAMDGVERGNIVSWRQEVSRGLEGQRLEFGAVMDRRSILGATVALFAGAIVCAVLLLALGVSLVFWRGRRARQVEGGAAGRAV